MHATNHQHLTYATNQTAAVAEDALCCVSTDAVALNSWPQATNKTHACAHNSREPNQSVHPCQTAHAYVNKEKTPARNLPRYARAVRRSRKMVRSEHSVDLPFFPTANVVVTNIATRHRQTKKSTKSHTAHRHVDVCVRHSCVPHCLQESHPQRPHCGTRRTNQRTRKRGETTLCAPPTSVTKLVGNHVAIDLGRSGNICKHSANVSNTHIIAEHDIPSANSIQYSTRTLALIV